MHNFVITSEIYLYTMTFISFSFVTSLIPMRVCALLTVVVLYITFDLILVNEKMIPSSSMIDETR